MIKYPEYKENDDVYAHAMELYYSGNDDELIKYLMGYEKITFNPSMSYLLAQTLLDKAEKVPTFSSEIMVRIAETLLFILSEEGDITPDVLYQKARCHFFREQYAAAIFELRTALTFDPEKYDFICEDEVLLLLDACIECTELTRNPYTDKKREAVLEHISKHFGKIERIFTSTLTGRELEIAVISPSKERDYCTLVTIGAGAYPMNGFLSPDSHRYAEFLMLIPSDKENEAERYSEILIKTATLTGDKDSYFVSGMICDIFKPNLPELPYDFMIVTPAERLSEGASTCNTKDDAEISFYQLFPVYKGEAQYCSVHGYEKTIEAIDGKLASIGVFLTGRNNTRQGYSPESDNALMCDEVNFSEKLKEVGELCVCSRRIINDGCNVGRMFRINPSSTEVKPFCEADSGWIITAGNEDPDYLMNPNNLPILPLNTLVNLCYDVLPFLHNPPGTVITRQANGKLIIATNDD